MKEETTDGISWETLDGQQHQLLVLKKNGGVVKKIDPSSKKGETRKVSVKWSSDLSTYCCNIIQMGARENIHYQLTIERRQ